MEPDTIPMFCVGRCVSPIPRNRFPPSTIMKIVGESSTEFPQTLQGGSSIVAVSVLPVDQDRGPANAAGISVLGSPEPPTAWQDIARWMKGRRAWICEIRLQEFVVEAFKGLFPILQWGWSYDLKMFKGDFMAGLTIASLGVPQGICYANLAKLDPQYGLYTSVVPPLIYALMGTSKEIAIGPVAVVSLLVSSMVQRLVDPHLDPISYRSLVFTSTFFAGVFQAIFGILRLGFLVDFLSRASAVGFMAGAAVVIALQQAKPLLGISRFTNRTDVVSVARSIFSAINEQPWHPFNFVIGSFFLIFILLSRFLGRKNKKLFWVSAMAPLLAVILSTLLVFLTRADEHGVKTIQNVKGGMNPSSLKELRFSGDFVGETAKIGLVCALIALAEAISVGKSFASIHDYDLDGNKEMLAMGIMNMAGSLSSCYVATGSFSRTAVNFSAGCKSSASNMVMAAAVAAVLHVLTRVLYYTPVSILASVIVSALPALIDVGEASRIWKVDKIDFAAGVVAFAGVLFGSVEIGLLASIVFSLSRILLSSIRPKMEELGRIHGSTDVFVSVRQYPAAGAPPPGLVVVRVDSSFICFLNANYIKNKIASRAVVGEDEQNAKAGGARTRSVIVDMSNVMNIDTAGIAAIKELRAKLLALHNIQVSIANPGWNVIHKMKLDGISEKIGERWIFLTVDEAVGSSTININT